MCLSSESLIKLRRKSVSSGPPVNNLWFAPRSVAVFKSFSSSNDSYISCIDIRCVVPSAFSICLEMHH